MKANSVDQQIMLLIIKGLKLQSKADIYTDVKDHLATSNKENMICKHILYADSDHCWFIKAEPFSLTGTQNDQLTVPITQEVQLFTDEAKWQQLSRDEQKVTKD